MFCKLLFTLSSFEFVCFFFFMDEEHFSMLLCNRLQRAFIRHLFNRNVASVLLTWKGAAVESLNRYIQVFGFSLSTVIGSQVCTRVYLSAVFKTKWLGRQQEAGKVAPRWARQPGIWCPWARCPQPKWVLGSALGRPFGQSITVPRVALCRGWKGGAGLSEPADCVLHVKT